MEARKGREEEGKHEENRVRFEFPFCDVNINLVIAIVALILSNIAFSER